MNDLFTRMERLGGTIEPASEDAIAADIARARSAVRKRRTVQAMAGSAFGVAALVATFSFTGVMTNDDSGTPPVAAVAPSAAGNLRLVDYTGKQPQDFTVDMVPEGFFIQNADWTGLTIAPDSAKNPGPDVDPSTSPMYDPRDYTGKIAVFLEMREFRGELSGDKLTVGGKEAILRTNVDGVRQLVIAVDPEVYATVQFDVPLSRAQMLEVGAGLHVHQGLIDRMAAAAGQPNEKVEKELKKQAETGYMGN
ncbi:hypothetical protein [Symbioplanes lichenis]|uniref:hypothetical protein n=1 Tax=Symbioplanes lichenis TaxID=1629072 RepID=UPI002739D739|nr:hypothetical protein [Actinoplanes lichenis]